MTNICILSRCKSNKSLVYLELKISIEFLKNINFVSKYLLIKI